eukprot:TRINITY_DN2467_c0_g2_i1.p1 TRINITY_DN2467_c0_g2~~TRINITY_DN2467_c0_g2_i1.p1  ORF type:complete len:479 (+),score=96.54 TRINITY_DN2467_c0_g2_i1:93-1529(+)
MLTAIYSCAVLGLIGDYWMNGTVQCSTNCTVNVTVEISPEGEGGWILHGGEMLLVRNETVLTNRSFDGLQEGANEVAYLKRGSFGFLWVGEGFVGFYVHLLGEIDCRDGEVGPPSPTDTTATITADEGAVTRQHITRVEYEDRPLPSQPILSRNPDPKSWYSRQAIPGAVLYHSSHYYIFFCGADMSQPHVESGGQIRTGLARSKNLHNWETLPDAVLTGTAGSWDQDQVCVNGAVIQNGTVLLTYTGYNTSANVLHYGAATVPLDRIWHARDYNKVAHPILSRGNDSWDSEDINEHELFVYENGTLALFYTGCCDARCRDGFCDQGGLATSDDITKPFTKYAGNPVFKQGPVSDQWDSKHRRPRGLNKVDGWYYLQYEGAGFNDMNPNCTRDSVGLARSKDLHNWEFHPLQQSIPWGTGTSFDSMWTGWPRTIINNGTAHVFYAAGGTDFLNVSRRWASTGVRSWNFSKYLSWTTMP